MNFLLLLLQVVAAHGDFHKRGVRSAFAERSQSTASAQGAGVSLERRRNTAVAEGAGAALEGAERQTVPTAIAFPAAVAVASVADQAPVAAPGLPPALLAACLVVAW